MALAHSGQGHFPRSLFRWDEFTKLNDPGGFTQESQVPHLMQDKMKSCSQLQALKLCSDGVSWQL